MNTVLPENILSKMSPADRKSIGQQTAAEAREKYEAGQEKELQRDIRNFLTHTKAAYFHQSPFNKRSQGKLGHADFLVCYRGRWLSIEAKSEIGKQRAEQVIDQANVETAGGIYLLARSVHAVQQEFRRIDAEIRILQDSLSKDGWTHKSPFPVRS